MVGQYGGAIFVLIYIACLIVLGIPAMTMEFAIGRAAQRSPARMFRELEPPRSKWHFHGIACLVGNIVLMMFYNNVAGWMMHYFVKTATGTFEGMDTEGVNAEFGAMLGDPVWQTVFMAIAVIVGIVVCMKGVQKGVERVTKWMMLSLLALMGVLAVKSLSLPGAAKGLEFYLKPDWSYLAANPGKVVVNAMAQAFFTLSIGVGAMTIFGSYIDRRQSLVKEVLWIELIDTFVAFTAGLIIFPACATYGVKADAGPGLIFEALPKVFAAMPGGRFWAFVFFMFLSLAALTTVIAVFECLIGGLLDTFRRWRRQAAAVAVGCSVAVLSLPCVFFDSALQWEDCIFSKFFLPIGGLALMLFVSWRFGWGWRAFREEASAGEGPALPSWLQAHFRYVVPALILIILVMGFRG
jgi:NSS family neurotransmitter:Na+ symporter